MDSNYRPQSPDLSSYAPQSPDLSGYHPQSPDLSALQPPHYGNFGQANHGQGGYGPPPPGRFQGAFGSSNGFAGQYHHQITSVPPLPASGFDHQPFDPSGVMPQQYVKHEEDSEWLPESQGPNKRPRRTKKEPGFAQNADFGPGTPELPDPTLGCSLKTQFPVARIKRLMQADEDIGKVAQVTPTVVSRALELFMIKIISASADQARGGAQGGGGKGPKRILVQHLKKAVLAEEKFDFLREIVDKVPDAPAKAKKEGGSDSEDASKVRKKGKKRKDSGDDF